MMLTTEQLEIIEELVAEYEEEFEACPCFDFEDELEEYGEKHAGERDPEKFRQSLREWIEFKIDDLLEDYDEEDDE